MNYESARAKAIFDLTAEINRLKIELVSLRYTGEEIRVNEEALERLKKQREKLKGELDRTNDEIESVQKYLNRLKQEKCDG